MSRSPNIHVTRLGAGLAFGTGGMADSAAWFCSGLAVASVVGMGVEPG
jgi:hypothetical protein